MSDENIRYEPPAWFTVLLYALMGVSVAFGVGGFVLSLIYGQDLMSKGSHFLHGSVIAFFSSMMAGALLIGAVLIAPHAIFDKREKEKRE